MMLNDMKWDEQLREVIKAYNKGLITHAECVLKQSDIIITALLSGVSFEDINKFEL